jgi:hypothetical protein
LVNLEWPERGKGTLRLLQNKTTKSYRIVMRADLTYRLIINFSLFPELHWEITNGDKGVKFSFLEIEGNEKKVKTYFATLSAGKDRKEKTNEKWVEKFKRTMRIVKKEATEEETEEEREEERLVSGQKVR